MEVLIIIVLALLAVAAASTVSSRLGIAAPLLLTLVGIAVSLLPFMEAIHVEPEWILEGVLPPLLYSAAVSVPTMEFRRDFNAISGLSVALVVISSLLLGLLFAWLVPGLGLAGGIALGAIVSPTDAVALSIVKRLGVASRVVALLEGESLLNDASALVLLRSAIAGMAASVSPGGVAGEFLYAVALAVAIGYAVGWLNLRVRARIKDSTVNTIISFTLPFIASLPVELLGGSGLVAAVVAGLVTGSGAPRFLSPRHRLSDSTNWRTIEMVLEGGVFLLMGLELTAVTQDVYADNTGLGGALGIAALAVLASVLIRAAFVAPLLGALKRRAERSAQVKVRIQSLQQRLDAPAGAAPVQDIRFGPRPLPPSPKRDKRLAQLQLQQSPERIERLQTWLRRQLADIDYFLAEPLGWREGAVVVWAGMRGVVTLAAAQTLPESMPNRSLLVFVAFLVAVGSLLLQGGTLPWLVRRLQPADGEHHGENGERAQLLQLLDQTAIEVMNTAGLNDLARQFQERLIRGDDEVEAKMRNYQRVRLQIIEAQRGALLAARDNGEFSAAALNAALENLDADQISLELRGNPNEQ